LSVEAEGMLRVLGESPVRSLLRRLIDIKRFLLFPRQRLERDGGPKEYRSTL